MSLFNTANSQQVKALAQCGTPEMAPLRDLLTTELDKVLDKLVKTDASMQLYRLQGEAIVLDDLLKAITGAFAHR